MVVSDEIPTVVTVRWTPDDGEVEDAYVEYGSDRSYGLTAPAWPAEDGQEGEYEAWLLGLKPSSSYHLRPAVVVDGEPMIAAHETVETGAPPPELPATTVLDDGGSATGGFLVTTVINNPPVVAILDRDGDFVWWTVLESEEVASTRAYLSRDRRAMVYRHNVQDGEALGLVRRGLDGADEQVWPVQDEHHDFVELPDGSYAVLTLDVREVEGEEVIGDKVVELAPDGTLTDLWSVWDHVNVDPDTFEDPTWGFAHANAIDHDPATDALIVGTRRLNTLFAFDRHTGDPLWQLGGQDSDYALPDGGTTFSERQHQFDLLDDGVLIFDNGLTDRLESRAVEYHLDSDDGSAEQVWSYTSDPVLYCFALGDTSRLPDGETLVVFSTSGQIDQVSPDGERTWRLRLSLGGALGYTTWVESLYPE